MLAPAFLWARRRHIVYGVAFGLVLVAAAVALECLQGTEANGLVSRKLAWLKASRLVD